MDASRSGRRFGVVVALLVLLGVLAMWLAHNGPGSVPPTCTFHEVTGLHCAGCGMTRATHAALDGRFVDAFLFNPLGVVLVPLVVLALVPEVIGWVRGVAPKWRVPIGRRLGIGLVVLIIGFMVLRNLPWEPFRWLAPS